MTAASRPPAEVAIDLSLVRSLLQAQHPDLASLSLTAIAEGWDNRIFRLGRDLAVRLPRRAASAALVEHEQQWLPQLAPRLPLPIPAPVRLGRPGCGFPWHWSVVPWLAGESAVMAPWDPQQMAAGLGHFVRALHQPAPGNAPRNAWRGIPLAARDEAFQRHLQQLERHVDRDAVLSLWHHALSAPPWPGPPLWIHGDLHPANLLVRDQQLSAVIDFGDLAAGDPATDLSVMWMLLPAAARPAFWQSAQNAFNHLDAQTHTRARGWALALGLSWLATSQDDETMQRIGRAAIDSALAE